MTKIERIKNKARSLQASLRSYGISMSAKELTTILSDGVICIYCNTKVPTKLVSPDHKLPRSRGGSDTIENIQLTCRGCNFAKGSLTDEEFKCLLEFLNQHPIIKANVLPRLKAGGAAMHGWKGSGM